MVNRGVGGLVVLLLPLLGHQYASCQSTVSSGLVAGSQELEMDKMIAKIDAAARPDRAIPEYQELAFEFIRKVEGVKPEEILKRIFDNRHAEITQYIMFDVYNSKLSMSGSRPDRSVVVSILKNAEGRNDLKSVVLNYLDKNDLQLLKEFVECKDLKVKSSALRHIYRLDKEAGYHISCEIFARKNKENEQLVEFAMFNMADYLSRSTDVKAKSRFVDGVVGILNASNSADVQYSCAMALESVKYSEAIKILLNNDRIESNKRYFAIEKNCDVLIGMLASDPEQNIGTVIGAVELNPLKDFLPALEGVRHSVKSEVIIKRISAAIEKINKENRFAFCDK